MYDRSVSPIVMYDEKMKGRLQGSFLPPHRCQPHDASAAPAFSPVNPVA